MNDQRIKSMVNFIGFIFGVCLVFIFLFITNSYNKLNTCDVDDGINDTIIIKVGKVCYYNAYEIDCNNDLPYDTITTDGNFDCRPIIKTDKDWKDILNKEKE